MTRSRGIFANLVLGAVTILVLLLGAEAVLRLTYHPDNLGTVIRFDAKLGWSLAPNTSHRAADATAGVDYFVRINAFGLREREFKPQPQKGHRRVLVLGDSFTFGTGVDNDERFTDFLQRALDDDVEVINAGVPGWGTDQELLYFESVAERLQPDVVVLTMMVGNDVVNTMLDHLFLRTAKKPTFTLDGGSLRLTSARIEPPRHDARTRARMLLRRSRLLLFVKRRLDRRRHELTPDPTAHHSPEYLAAHPRDALTHWSVYRSSYDEAFEDGFEVTEALLARLAQDCRERGCELLVFAFPLRLELDDAWREGLMVHNHIAPDEIDMRKPYDRLARFCGEQDIAFVYPFDDFKRAYAHQYLYYEHDEHPNIQAHALAARVLLDVFRERYRMNYHLAGSDRPYYDAVGF